MSITLTEYWIKFKKNLEALKKSEIEHAEEVSAKQALRKAVEVQEAGEPKDAFPVIRREFVSSDEPKRKGEVEGELKRNKDNERMIVQLFPLPKSASHEDVTKPCVDVARESEEFKRFLEKIEMAIKLADKGILLANNPERYENLHKEVSTLELQTFNIGDFVFDSLPMLRLAGKYCNHLHRFNNEKVKALYEDSHITVLINSRLIEEQKPTLEKFSLWYKRIRKFQRTHQIGPICTPTPEKPTKKRFQPGSKAVFKSFKERLAKLTESERSEGDADKYDILSPDLLEMDVKLEGDLKQFIEGQSWSRDLLNCLAEVSKTEVDCPIPLIGTFNESLGAKRKTNHLPRNLITKARFVNGNIQTLLFTKLIELLQNRYGQLYLKIHPGDEKIQLIKQLFDFLEKQSDLLQQRNILISEKEQQLNNFHQQRKDPLQKEEIVQKRREEYLLNWQKRVDERNSEIHELQNRIKNIEAMLLKLDPNNIKEIEGWSNKLPDLKTLTEAETNFKVKSVLLENINNLCFLTFAYHQYSNIFLQDITIEENRKKYFDVLGLLQKQLDRAIEQFAKLLAPAVHDLLERIQSAITTESEEVSKILIEFELYKVESDIRKPVSFEPAVILLHPKLKKKIALSGVPKEIVPTSVASASAAASLPIDSILDTTSHHEPESILLEPKQVGDFWESFGFYSPAISPTEKDTMSDPVVSMGMEEIKLSEESSLVAGDSFQKEDRQQLQQLTGKKPIEPSETISSEDQLSWFKNLLHCTTDFTRSFFGAEIDISLLELFRVHCSNRFFSEEHDEQYFFVSKNLCSRPKIENVYLLITARDSIVNTILSRNIDEWRTRFQALQKSSSGSQKCADLLEERFTVSRAMKKMLEEKFQVLLEKLQHQERFWEEELKWRKEIQRLNEEQKRVQEEAVKQQLKQAILTAQQNIAALAATQQTSVSKFRSREAAFNQSPLKKRLMAINQELEGFWQGGMAPKVDGSPKREESSQLVLGKTHVSSARTLVFTDEDQLSEQRELQIESKESKESRESKESQDNKLQIDSQETEKLTIQRNKVSVELGGLYQALFTFLKERLIFQKNPKNLLNYRLATRLLGLAIHNIQALRNLQDVEAVEVFIKKESDLQQALHRALIECQGIVAFLDNEARERKESKEDKENTVGNIEDKERKDQKDAQESLKVSASAELVSREALGSGKEILSARDGKTDLEIIALDKNKGSVQEPKSSRDKQDREVLGRVGSQYFGGRRTSISEFTEFHDIGLGGHEDQEDPWSAIAMSGDDQQGPPEKLRIDVPGAGSVLGGRSLLGLGNTSSHQHVGLGLETSTLSWVNLGLGGQIQGQGQGQSQGQGQGQRLASISASPGGENVGVVSGSTLLQGLQGLHGLTSEYSGSTQSVQGTHKGERVVVSAATASATKASSGESKSDFEAEQHQLGLIKQAQGVQGAKGAEEASSRHTSGLTALGTLEKDKASDVGPKRRLDRPVDLLGKSPKTMPSMIKPFIPSINVSRIKSRKLPGGIGTDLGTLEEDLDDSVTDAELVEAFRELHGDTGVQSLDSSADLGGSFDVVDDEGNNETSEGPQVAKHEGVVIDSLTSETSEKTENSAINVGSSAGAIRYLSELGLGKASDPGVAPGLSMAPGLSGAFGPDVTLPIKAPTSPQIAEISAPRVGSAHQVDSAPQISVAAPSLIVREGPRFLGSSPDSDTEKSALGSHQLISPAAQDDRNSKAQLLIKAGAPCAASPSGQLADHLVKAQPSSVSSPTGQRVDRLIKVGSPDGSSPLSQLGEHLVSKGQPSSTSTPSGQSVDRSMNASASCAASPSSQSTLAKAEASEASDSSPSDSNPWLRARALYGSGKSPSFDQVLSAAGHSPHFDPYSPSQPAGSDSMRGGPAQASSPSKGPDSLGSASSAQGSSASAPLGSVASAKPLTIQTQGLPASPENLESNQTHSGGFLGWLASTISSPFSAPASGSPAVHPKQRKGQFS